MKAPSGRVARNNFVRVIPVSFRHFVLNLQLRAACKNSFVVGMRILEIFAGFFSSFISGFTLSSIKGGLSKGRRRTFERPKKQFCQ
jgi:hypothetical protein